MQGKVSARFLWIVAAAIGTAIVVMVASTVSAGAERAVPTTQEPCEPVEVYLVRFSEGAPTRQMVDPADRAAGWARSAATRVRGQLQIERDYSFVYLPPDPRSSLTLSFDLNGSPNPLLATVQCVAQ